MEILIGIIGLILAVAVPLFIYLCKKHHIRPELTIEINNTGSQSSPIGLSDKKKPDENNVILVTEVIRVFELSWNIEIVVRNNSDNVAYYPKIYFKEGTPHFIRMDKLNVQEPVSSTESKTLKLTYKEIEEAKGSDRNNMVKLPDALMNIEVLLEYNNSNKITFYTLYNNKDKSNYFLKQRPKGF